jgi:hypothetical protein
MKLTKRDNDLLEELKGWGGELCFTLPIPKYIQKLADDNFIKISPHVYMNHTRENEVTITLINN